MAFLKELLNHAEDNDLDANTLGKYILVFLYIINSYFYSTYGNDTEVEILVYVVQCTMHFRACGQYFLDLRVN